MDMVAGVLRELQRRNVIRAAILYVTAVWALTQGIAALEPVVGAPAWVARWFLVAAALGFPFWIAFAWFYELTPEGVKRESEVDADKSILTATGRKLDFLIIGVLTVAVVLLLTDRLLRRDTENAPSLVLAEKSVAVLPLVNESGEADALYFSDGLSEAFIDALSQFPGLKVIARASSFQFRNSKEPVSVIGEKLGVAHLLEGSVQLAGGAVRISAELIAVKDGTAIWSQHYDRLYRDLFRLQDDVTRAVATSLKAKLLGSNAPSPQSERPPRGSLDAYNAYLEGIFYSHRAAIEDQRRAVVAFNRAVGLDPDYAAAWARLSTAEDNLASISSSSAPMPQVLTQVRAHAEKAVALAPKLALAHNALGNVFADELNWISAEAEFRQAVQMAPSYAGAQANLANIIATLGRPEEAAAVLHHALKLDPLRALSYLYLAEYLMPLRRLDEAEAAIRKAIALQPDGNDFYGRLSQIDILRGNPEAAMADAQREPTGPFHDIAVTLAQQIGKDSAAADAALKELIAKARDDSPYQIAEAYALRKEPDKLFQWLEHARAAKDAGLQSLLIDPFILLYRHDARFLKMCDELKLPAPKN